MKLVPTGDAIKPLLTPKQIALVKMFIKGQSSLQIAMNTGTNQNAIKLQMGLARKRMRCENNMQLASILTEAGIASAREK